jgi:hypothetical protein
MPRRKSLLTIIRDLVQQEVGAAIQSLLGTISPRKTKPKNGRRPSTMPVNALAVQERGTTHRLARADSIQ